MHCRNTAREANWALIQTHNNSANRTTNVQFLSSILSSVFSHSFLQMMKKIISCPKIMAHTQNIFYPYNP